MYNLLLLVPLILKYINYQEIKCDTSEHLISNNSRLLFNYCLHGDFHFYQSNGSISMKSLLLLKCYFWALITSLHVRTAAELKTKNLFVFLIDRCLLQSWRQRYYYSIIPCSMSTMKFRSCTMSKYNFRIGYFCGKPQIHLAFMWNILLF